ncbi:hypothetical protein H696_03819 [Fonticula alba]|uniref:Uncharacterized protein n=1 Tax=Fonticula alba TaxID=691883 RepID=A0A058Z630_FONAL|nr:hypothetical protein H696_03819 [Fonticula alba]KCV69388.1 hypothetical protein H696_03819 [Fonticula alba]|eukprot:XP_009495953.1 hypothetical protein H696_03819 [Fonticula alba]
MPSIEGYLAPVGGGLRSWGCIIPHRSRFELFRSGTSATPISAFDLDLVLGVHLLPQSLLRVESYLGESLTYRADTPRLSRNWVVRFRMALQQNEDNDSDDSDPDYNDYASYDMNTTLNERLERMVVINKEARQAIVHALCHGKDLRESTSSETYISNLRSLLFLNGETPEAETGTGPEAEVDAALGSKPASRRQVNSVMLSSGAAAAIGAAARAAEAAAAAAAAPAVASPAIPPSERCLFMYGVTEDDESGSDSDSSGQLPGHGSSSSSDDDSDDEHTSHTHGQLNDETHHSDSDSEPSQRDSSRRMSTGSYVSIDERDSTSMKTFIAQVTEAVNDVLAPADLEDARSTLDHMCQLVWALDYLWSVTDHHRSIFPNLRALASLANRRCMAAARDYAHLRFRPEWAGAPTGLAAATATPPAPEDALGRFVPSPDLWAEWSGSNPTIEDLPILGDFLGAVSVNASASPDAGNFGSDFRLLIFSNSVCWGCVAPDQSATLLMRALPINRITLWIDASTVLGIKVVSADYASISSSRVPAPTLVPLVNPLCDSEINIDDPACPAFNRKLFVDIFDCAAQYYLESLPSTK